MTDDTETPADGNANDGDEELKRLLKERGLVPRTAYIKDPEAAKKRSKGADRVARFRERMRESGFTQAPVPEDITAAVKNAGGWTQWVAELKAAAAAGAAPTLSADDQVALDLGRRAARFRGWRLALLRWMLG